MRAPETALEPTIREHQVAQFFRNLNAAVPELELTPEDVIHVYAGLLPGRCAGSAEPATRAIIHDHGAHGGPNELYTISGIKFTTARRVAENTLRAVFGRQLRPPASATPRPAPLLDFTTQTLLAVPRPAEAGASEILMRRIVCEEAVLCPEDLLLRRLDSTQMLLDRKGFAVLRRALAPLTASPSDADRSGAPPEP